jgi:hypothetical protein
MKTTMSSLQKVVATPELLEAILAQLDVRTLLVSAQLVSHYFYDIVSSSVRLQQALFFIPEPLSDGPVDAVCNPLLLNPFRFWFQPSGRASFKHRGYSVHSFRAMSVWNSDARDKFMRRRASWRRMLVQQPAPTSLGFVSRNDRIAPAVEVEGTIDFPRGLSMGALYDITQHRLGIATEYTSYFFRILRPECQPEGETPRPITKKLLQDHKVVFEEYGFYPSQDVGSGVDVSRWDHVYAHPERSKTDIDLETVLHEPGSTAQVPQSLNQQAADDMSA